MAELRVAAEVLVVAWVDGPAVDHGGAPVAGWHDTGVAKAITANDVQRLLDSCDISDSAGVRDYAILMLVARVGLRSIEVARLQLDNLDWRAGRIVLRGKASREDGMPLPADVAEALSAYLRQARPATPLRCATRHSSGIGIGR